MHPAWCDELALAYDLAESKWLLIGTANLC
jgi:hypothetical protein